MTPRARSRLDLLPLLDVFIVVLFVFATVHERKIDESVQVSEQLAARVEVLERALDDAQAIIDGAEDAEQARTRVLLERTARAERALENVERETSAAFAQWAPGEDAVRQHDVFRKLLDHFTVFEIEVTGGSEPSEIVRNGCCFRVDLDARSWRACGHVPADPHERRAWMAEGADGLSDALRRTKGGNAMVVVRQDGVATHRIGSKLGDLLREQFPSHQIYAGGVAPSEVSCAAP